MTKKEQRRLLTRYAEALVLSGYDISDLFATPLSHFNYEVIQKHIEGYEAAQEAGEFYNFD